MKTIKSHFGRRLRELREAAGLTQAESDPFPSDHQPVDPSALWIPAFAIRARVAVTGELQPLPFPPDDE